MIPEPTDLSRSEIAAQKRDAKHASRKGRPPKNGTAMSAAERKRLQRERERAAKADAPRWLRYRREIWQMVRDRFIFADAEELALAVQAVSTAIIASAIWQDQEGWEPKKYLAPLEVLNNPSAADKDSPTIYRVIREYYPELCDHKPQGVIKTKRLIELFCDPPEASRNESDHGGTTDE